MAVWYHPYFDPDQPGRCRGSVPITVAPEVAVVIQVTSRSVGISHDVVVGYDITVFIDHTPNQFRHASAASAARAAIEVSSGRRRTPEGVPAGVAGNP